ncbi:hypothetical protein YC2023_096181 [Brassica napus]
MRSASIITNTRTMMAELQALKLTDGKQTECYSEVCQSYGPDIQILLKENVEHRIWKDVNLHKINTACYIGSLAEENRHTVDHPP